MGCLSPDPYHQPEHYGLEIVGTIEWDNEPYQFNLTAIWRHLETGVLYIASDSGCSCPSPFERYEDEEVNEVLASLERVKDVDALKEILNGYNGNTSSWREQKEYIRCQAEIHAIINNLKSGERNA